MIAAALCVVLGGVTFEHVDIPDVYAGPGYALQGGITMDLRHADLDGDGQLDLLLPTRVYLRPGGRLDPNQSIPMPDVPPQSRADVWGDTVYVLSPNVLATYKLQDGAWKQSAQFDYVWAPPEGFRDDVDSDAPSITFGRFLHDVDGDGRPEIIRINDDGISVGEVKAHRIESVVLDVYPSPRVQPGVQANALWPASERRVAFPNRRVRFNVVIDGQSVRVIEAERRLKSEIVYTVHDYKIVAKEETGFVLARESTQQTEAIPFDLDPIALNADDTLDFAGYRYEKPTYNQWKPAFRGLASTDMGKTVQVAVTRGFLPRAIFVDLDGDGDLDWLGDASGLVDGGFRETANRALFQKTFSHKLLARMQNSDGTFEKKWQTLGTFTIQLDKPARHYTYRCWQYMMGDLIDCTGDFNGDGWRDALVFATPETVSVFLGGPDGFNARAETEFAVPPHKVPCAFDVDGDGLSDVVIRDRSMWNKTEIYLNGSNAG